jgi:hypothetical protein
MTGIAFIPCCQALVKRKMMYFKRKLQQEDAPANSAGGGAIAGIGVGPQGEPGISRSVMKKYKKRNDSGKEAQEIELSLMKRNTPLQEMIRRTISDKAIADAATRGDEALNKKYKYGTVKGGVSPLAYKRREQGFGSQANFNSAKAAIISKNRGESPKAQDTAVHKGWGKTVDQTPAPDPTKQKARKKLQKTPFYSLSKDEQEKDTVLRKAVVKEENHVTGTFAGQTTFVVPSNIFHEARMSKKKGKHWRTYIGEDDHWKHIREYAMNNPKKAVILQDKNTGSMCYARYGSK